MALSSVGTFWKIATKVDRLLQFEEKNGEAIAHLQKQIDLLAARIAQLEAREEVVVAKAQTAAMGAATAGLAEFGRQLGMVQQRLIQLDGRG